MSYYRPSIVALAFFTVLTGVIYPLAIWLTAQAMLPYEANGSILTVGGKKVASALLAQNTNGSTAYFAPRPSAGKYFTIPSGASNIALTSPSFHSLVAERRRSLLRLYGSTSAAATEMVTSSASGLDPHISPLAAMAQVETVAATRGTSVTAVRQLVASAVEYPQLGFLGTPRVNVTMLNHALDRRFPRNAQ